MYSASLFLPKLMSQPTCLAIGTGGLVRGAIGAGYPQGVVFDQTLMVVRDTQLGQLADMFNPPLTAKNRLMQLMMGLPKTLPELGDIGAIQGTRTGSALTPGGASTLLKGIAKVPLKEGVDVAGLQEKLNEILTWPFYAEFNAATVVINPSHFEGQFGFSFEAVGLPRRSGEQRMDLFRKNLPRLIGALVVHMSSAKQHSVLAMPSNPMSHFLPVLRKVDNVIEAKTGKTVILAGPASLDSSRAEKAIKQVVSARRGVEEQDVQVRVKAQDEFGRDITVPGAAVMGRHDATMVVLRKSIEVKIQEGEWVPLSTEIDDAHGSLDDVDLQEHMRSELALTEEETESDATRDARMTASKESGRPEYVPLNGIVFKSPTTGETVTFSRPKLEARLKSGDATWTDIVIATRFGGAIVTARDGRSDMRVAASMNVETQDAFSSRDLTPIRLAAVQPSGLFSMSLVNAGVDRNGRPIVTPLTVEMDERQSRDLEHSLGDLFQSQIQDFSQPGFLLESVKTLRQEWESMRFFKAPADALETLGNLEAEYSKLVAQ